MAQHDINIANQGFPAFRSDLNSALSAIVSNSSGATEPSTTFAYQWWADTANDLLKQRNSTNDGWVSVITLSTGQPVGLGSTIQVYDSNLTGFVSAFTLPTSDGTSDQVLTTNGSGTLSFSSISATVYGLFRKVSSSAVAWTKTGNGTATTATTIYVEVNGTVLTIASGTSIDMPSLTAGTDYAIWAETDGSLQASSNHTTPPSANARKVGGFHYATGSNASAQAGGNTTAQINEYSFWDLKFRPTCDPRGMTLVAGGFWADIYLTGVDHHTNGTSKYNVTIADGSSPPKVPSNFGGNGSTTYGSYTWFEVQELLASHGKRTPTQQEFMALAYGTTEASSIGSDPSTTNWDSAYVSKWGCNQSSGCMNIWGVERGGAYSTGGWNANTEGRGSEYNAPNAVLLGGVWADGSSAGSRCSTWNGSASSSTGDIGSRGVCDHLILD